jgi:hypothetical protein
MRSSVPHRTRGLSCCFNHLLSNILHLSSVAGVVCIGIVISVKSLTWTPFQILPWLWLSCWVMPGPLLELHFLTFPQSARSHIPWSWPNSQNLRSPANSTPIETEKLNPTSHNTTKKSAGQSRLCDYWYQVVLKTRMDSNLILKR